MKPPAITRSFRFPSQRNRESGVTILLVAAAIVAIMAMAALSIDAVTLYLANAEAQRSADAAALAAARILSISGMTGDPANTPISLGNAWQLACASAKQVATAVAQQNSNNMGGAAGVVTVSFPNNSDTSACTGTTAAFGVNPLVTVQVQRTDLPTFFARIWGRRGASVSATATAEAFNSSNSDLVGNGATGSVIPVHPRCVKPWIVPNLDPGNASNPFVSVANGSITPTAAGIRIGGAAPGIVGEQFSLFADCKLGTSCALQDLAPQANQTGGSYDGLPAPPVNNLEYVPGDVPAASTAVPSCANDSPYQQAVGGCDQTTVYQCGVQNGNSVDLSENPGGATGDTATATQCLIHQATAGTISGQDTLDNTVYPFQISVGSSNPLGISGQITSSNSVVSLPIYDTPVAFNSGTTSVTIVGFLQVFINAVNADGSLKVTVLNVAGCGNSATGTAVAGSSPVPVRLITTP